MTISTYDSKALGKGLLAAVAMMLVLSVTLIGAQTVLGASAAVNLDQCRNGGLTTPQTSWIDCTGGGSGNSGWVNGNAGASNAHYAEGESISYRARLTNLKANDNVVLILGYDVIHSGVHAIDYLTDKNRWQTPETTVAADPDLPCSGVTCSPTTPVLAPIPDPTGANGAGNNINADPTKALGAGCLNGSTGSLQPTTSFNAVPSGERNMEFFNATPAANAITYVGTKPDLTKTNGDQEQQISVAFKANATSAVLAWGGHIASKFDWGCLGSPQSASGISGSPYHMRIKDMTVNGTHVNLGNQDRSLSAAAVISVSPGITTTLSAPSGTVEGTFHDSATITGATADAGGTVKYTVYADSSCTTFANVGLGASLGNAGTVTVTNGVVPDSNNVTFNTAGTYYWQAFYSGQGANQPATSACTSEILLVNPKTPSVTTTLSDAGPISIGTSVHDSATITGATANAGGTISYAIYSDNACSALVDDVTPTVNSVVNGVAPDSDSHQFNSAGTFYWQATYSGDTNNTGPVSSACTSETLVVSPNTPSAATNQDLIPNDTLTLTGATSNAGGHVDFYLFSPDNALTCSVANKDSADFKALNVALVGNDHASTSNTGATAFHATAEGTWTWLAIYSGDGNNGPATSNCVETFSIDNNINTP
jgi:hypothetical protein